MRNLKKVLALSLVFALVLSLGLTAAAADYKDQASLAAKNINAIELLKQLNVMTGDEKGNFDPSRELTRAELAKIIAVTKMSGNLELAQSYVAYAKTDAGKNLNYSDVNASDWFAGYVYYLTSEGVISGNAGKFDPKGKVTRAAAIKMVMGVMGYNAEKEGFTGIGWELRVMNKAIQAGILGDVNQAEANVSRSNAAQLLANGLNATGVVYNPATGELVQAEKTTLETVFPQYKAITGKLVSNKYANLNWVGSAYTGKVTIYAPYVSSSNPGGYVTINNTTDENAPVTLLGRNVRVYAKTTATKDVYNSMLGNATTTDAVYTIEQNSTKASDYTDHAAAIIPTAIVNGPSATVVYNNYKNANLTTANLTALQTNTNWIGGVNNTLTIGYGIKEVGQVYSEVMRNIYSLAKVTKVAGGKVTAVQFNDDTALFTDMEAAKFENGTTLAEGDVIATLLDGDKKPISATKLTKVEGTLSKVVDKVITVSGTECTVRDGNFQYNQSGLLASIAALANFGVTRTYYTFEGKVVAYVGVADAAKTYGVVLEQSTVLGATRVRMLLEDGTKKIFTVNSAKVGDTTTDFKFSPTTGAQFVAGTNELGKTTPTMFTYTVDGDKIDLKSVVAVTGTTLTSVTNSAAYVKGQTKFDSAALTASTRWFIYDAANEVNAFKGLAAADFTASGGQKFVKDGAIAAVAVTASTTIAASNDVYGILTADPVFYTDALGATQCDIKIFNASTNKEESYTIAKKKSEFGYAKGDILKVTISGTSMTDSTAFVPALATVGSLVSSQSSISYSGFITNYVGGTFGVLNVDAASASSIASNTSFARTFESKNDTQVIDLTGTAKVVSLDYFNSVSTMAPGHVYYEAKFVTNADGVVTKLFIIAKKTV